MRRRRQIARLASAPSSGKPLCLILLAVTLAVQVYGQSTTLMESTRAFYRGDYERAVQLAEKHLHEYPKDAPVRVMLARAELAQGKLQQGFDELRKALESDPKNIERIPAASRTSS